MRKDGKKLVIRKIKQVASPIGSGGGGGAGISKIGIEKIREIIKKSSIKSNEMEE